MVKRSRAAVRPGQRRPIQRRTATSPSAPGSPTPGSATPPRPSAGLTAAEAARAEELEAQIRADERAAEDARKRAVERSKARGDEALRPAGSLAVVAAHEYDYVMRDVRRIAVGRRAAPGDPVRDLVPGRGRCTSSGSADPAAGDAMHAPRHHRRPRAVSAR